MATSPAPARLRVLVASPHALIGDAVRAAFVHRGHKVVVIRWPRDTRRVSRRRRPPPADGLTEIGLLLSDLDSWSRMDAATLVVERIRVPWVALTTTPRGPPWGGLFAAGVDVVLPGDTDLERVCDLLVSVAARQVATPTDERTGLEAAWREQCLRHRGVAERISRLTPREREVLDLLYLGSSVMGIAETFKVTPATVRTQVKAVLRKLGVKSQLAAVATFDIALDEFDQRVPYRVPSTRPVAPADHGSPRR
jgi:DNA-binding NarL/FixJ family response regulator